MFYQHSYTAQFYKLLHENNVVLQIFQVAQIFVKVELSRSKTFLPN